MHRRPLATLLVLFVMLAGTPALAVEPDAPAFAAPRTLPRSNGFGEPSIAIAPDGTMYVTAPGAHSAVWRSDDGVVWLRVADSLGSSGDSDVAVDANGVVYVSDLFASVPVSTSFDRATTFAYESRSTTAGSLDRQWLAASGDGHVFSTVRSGGTEMIGVSHDRGVSWTQHVVATGVNLRGNVLAVDDDTLLIPYQGDGLRLAKSTDGGVTWRNTFIAGTSGSNLFPAVAVDAAGVIYVAWSVKSNFDTGYSVRFSRSLDGGERWSAPLDVSPRGTTSIFPWILAGDAGRVAVAWFEARPATGVPLAADVSSLTPWVVRLAYTQNGDAGLASEWTLTDATGVFHTGPICTMGISCFPEPNPVAMNRALLDFFEMAMMEDGRIVIAYAADDTSVTSTLGVTQTVLKTVRQTGGPDL